MTTPEPPAAPEPPGPEAKLPESSPPDAPLSRLMVPLDGSRLAEAVFPATEALAEHFHSHVTLIHVLEKRPPATVHGDRHLGSAAEAQAYLADAAERLRARGIDVEMHVHDAPEGDLAGSVTDHSEEFEPELVILCSHGRGGLRGLLYGSIAQQVLQRGARPVLVVQPGEDGTAPPFDPRRILVPLDGKHEQEGALSMALVLARSFGAELHLVFVVPTLGTLSGDRAASAVWLPTTTRALLDLDEQEAGEYLLHVAEQCREAGVQVVAEVLRGETVASVLQHAQRIDAGLIVMSSHGRTGLKAILGRSSAARIGARAETPLLLVRA